MRVRFTRAPRWCRAVCTALLVAFPASLIAQETQGAMLTARGNVTVNGRPVATSQAVLPGDLAVTQADSGANLTLPGSSLVTSPETALRFESSSAVLERGGVAVNTQRGFSIHVGCLTIVPVDAANWTEFSVNYETSSSVLIQARRGDLRIAGQGRDGAAQKSEALSAGREIRREACPAAAEEHKRRPGGGAATAASSGPLNSTKALVIGAAGVGAVTTIFLLKDEKPVSPDKP